jgi:branched-chain amino acid transport system substrate-binding protein
MKTCSPSRLVVALFVALAIGTPWPIVAQPQPIRIGISLSLTGGYASFGAYAREGYQLCRKHVNEKGGVLGRPIEFVIHDDRSEPQTAALLYEKLISEDKVDAVLGPYSTPIVDAVANVTEKHRTLMIASMAATSSLWEKGRKYLIMVLSPFEALSEGLLDVAARNGLKTIALVSEEGIVPKTVVKGALASANKRNFDVVLNEIYAKGTTDFAAVLDKVKAAKPDVLVLGALPDDAVAFTRQLKARDINVKMFNSTPGGLLPEYYKQLSGAGEYVYSGSWWERGLAYPGNREFVEAYEREYNRVPVFHSADTYVACQLLVESARRVGSLDSDKIREDILKLRTKTLLGDFAVDERGFQIGHKAVTIQWQDGKQVVVWPDEVAAGKPRIPTPAWSGR